LGTGSSAGSYIARSPRPRTALAWSQLLLTLGVAWAAFMIARALSFWPINPSLSPSPWITFQLDVVRVAVAVFSAAALSGARLPLALAAVVGPGEDAGRLVGRVYAADTVGAILGSGLFTVGVGPQ